MDCARTPSFPGLLPLPDFDGRNRRSLCCEGMRDRKAIIHDGQRDHQAEPEPEPVERGWQHARPVHGHAEPVHRWLDPQCRLSARQHHCYPDSLRGDLRIGVVVERYPALHAVLGGPPPPPRMRPSTLAFMWQITCRLHKDSYLYYLPSATLLK